MDPTFTPLDQISTKVDSARVAFVAGSTRRVGWRVETLERVRELLVEREERLLDALAADLGKPRFEAWTTEVGFTIAEINYTLAHLATWMKPDKVATPIAFKP